MGRMKPHPLPVLALLSVLLACAACRSGGPQTAPESALAPTSPDLLERQVGVIVVSSRESAGRLELVLELVSRAEARLELAWAVEWLARDGTRLPSAPLQWTQARLEPAQHLRVEARAPVGGAGSWRLRVARPDALPLAAHEDEALRALPRIAEAR